MKMYFLSLLLTAACGATAAAHACEHCEHGDAPAPVADAMTVVRDAETGQLRAASADEIAAMRAKTKPAAAASAASRSAKTLPAATAQPAVRAYASGAHSAKLPSSMASYSVVRRQPDGTLDSRCVQGEQAASQALRGDTATQPTPTAPAKGDAE